MPRFARTVGLCLLLFSCAHKDPVIPCSSSSGLVAVPSGAVRVVVDGDAPELAPLKTDLPSYLAQLWSIPTPPVAAAADDAPGVLVWVSSSTAARDLMEGFVDGDAYGLRRIDSGGRALLLVYATDPRALASGAYALLEELGVRFFHPMQELVPKLGAPMLPPSLHAVRAPMTHQRGTQLHTLHPIEYLRVLDEAGDQNLADAKRLIDWLVKTGQNHLQWPLLATVPWDAFSGHAQQILSYAHSRGVTIGAVVQLFAASAFQNNFILVTGIDDANAQIEAGMDQVLALPFDRFEIALGEFVSADAQEVIDELDHAVTYAAARYPGVQVGTLAHVGNYPQLFVPYMGRTEYFYHLPQYCDPRLYISVHTVNFFDLYRDWGTYKEPDFHFQHDFLFEELGKRPLLYHPESAYWITADIDVPLFLPEYIYSRWLDVTSLNAELVAKGAQLDGHTMFSTGHEWNYWMTDYLIAHLLWQPTLGFPELLAHYGSAYGSCGAAVTQNLSAFTQLQTTYLFDQRLMGYLSGEDFEIDSGVLIGTETHPTRVPFEDVYAMSAADRATFTSAVPDALAALQTAITPLEADIAARCRGVPAEMKPFCDELRDGYSIVRLRAGHSERTYRAVLALADGDKDKANAYLADARDLTTQAAAVIAARELGYRFTDGRLTDAFPNPTVYAFGSLHQPHVQCFWKRRELQVDILIKTGVAAAIADVPSCQD